MNSWPFYWFLPPLSRQCNQNYKHLQECLLRNCTIIGISHWSPATDEAPWECKFCNFLACRKVTCRRWNWINVLLLYLFLSCQIIASLKYGFPVMKGHLSCGDTFAWMQSQRRPYKTGITVYIVVVSGNRNQPAKPLCQRYNTTTTSLVLVQLQVVLLILVLLDN